MSVVNSGIRAGAVAIALGLSMAGPHAAGTADADTGQAGSASASSGASPTGAKASTSRSARDSRPSAAATRPNTASRKATSVPRATAATPVDSASTSLPFRAKSADPSPVPIDGPSPTVESLSTLPATPMAAALSASTAPTAAQVIGSPVKLFFDSVSSWLSTLPANPIRDLLEGGLLLVRRTFFPSTLVSTASPVPTPVAADEPAPPTLEATTPSITIHNTSTTETIWIYNLTTSGDYSIPADFVPVEIAPLSSAPVTLAVGTGSPGSPENRIYIVSGASGISLPVDATSGIDAFNPTAATAGNSFLNYNFLEYYLYPGDGGYEYTIDTSYIDEWSLPIQFKFTKNGANWSGAVDGTTYGFKDYDTVVNQLTAAGGVYSDLVWSGSTPWGPQPPDTISRIIGPDKVWSQQSFEPPSNFNMNSTGWVPESYQNFVQGTVSGYTNPYAYNGTLYSSTGNFNFWKDSVNGPASTPYPIALRTAAILDGFPSVDGVYGFFTYPNDETAGQFTNIPTAVSLDIYVHGTSDGVTEGSIEGGTWLYSTPADTPGFPNPNSRETLAGTGATDTFILNYRFKRPGQAALVQAQGDDHDIVVIDANWLGATSTSVDFVDVANFKGTPNFTSQFVYERSTGNLYYDKNPYGRGYTAVLANLSQSEVIPERTIYVL